MRASEKMRFRAVARGPAEVRDGGGRAGDCGEAELLLLLLLLFSWVWESDWVWDCDGV